MVLVLPEGKNADGLADVFIDHVSGMPALVRRSRCEFGPVMRGRAPMLESRGLIAVGERSEELVVVRAVKPVL